MKNIEVSICSITFNHEKYIARTIESVLFQKTDFNYVLVIGEDCSTDKTREICVSYKTKYPDKIKLILNKRNIGASKNFINVLNNCQGQYIAICEGDDYWNDCFKLQKQVDFLKSNQEYGLIYSDIEVVNHTGETLPSEDQNIFKAKINYEGDILYKLIKYGNCINTLTVCFKRELISDWLKESHKKKYSYIQDYFLWLLIGSKSKVKFVNEKTASYRRHLGNISQDPYTIVGRKTWRYSETLGFEYYVKHNKNRIANEEYMLLLKNLIIHLIKKRELYLKIVTIKILIIYSFNYVLRKMI
ncbi:MAG: glycosyltransferase [Ignavibacteriales bacterium]|nr:glycosyltransferase [Ignavibacteriales bacterium]